VFSDTNPRLFSALPNLETVRHSCAAPVCHGSTSAANCFLPNTVMKDTDSFNGATENAGVENAIRAKLQGWKMQE